jgi:hypothetical protein
MMEAARTSETLENFYKTTRRYKPEDSHLRTHRRENLKSYLLFCASHVQSECSVPSNFLVMRPAQPKKSLVLFFFQALGMEI